MKKNLKKNLANIVTSFGILIGIFACFLALRGGSWVGAEVLFIMSLITDGVDGKIARKFGSTSWGAYLDDIADFINF
jgi:phosphatidylglycerophosphate synthase